jgi:catabolite regulation protein CreA
LKRFLDPAVGQATRIEIVLGFVEILLAIDLEAQDAGDRLVAPLENDAMMTAFFHCAQINSVGCFVSDLKTEGIDPEGARRSKISHRERDMIEPDNVKRRMQNRCRNGH